MNTYPVWRRATDLPLTVPAGNAGFRIEFRAFEVRDWFAWPLDLDAFTTGASEYDSLSDEAYCPCGAVLQNWDGSAGELLRMIYNHCAGNGHPIPVFDR